LTRRPAVVYVRRDEHEAKAIKREHERADLQRQIDVLRDRRWAPVHEVATARMEEAAKRALDLATANKDAECSAKNGGRGKDCRKLVAAEAAASERLQKIAASKAATDARAADEIELRRLEGELREKQAPVDVDPAMSALAAPLALLFTLDERNPAATVGKWWPHYIAVTMEVMTVGIPLLLRVVFFGRGRRRKLQDEAAQRLPAAVPVKAPVCEPATEAVLKAAKASSPAEEPPPHALRRLVAAIFRRLRQLSAEAPRRTAAAPARGTV
jgi:hypothetical protein